MKDATTREATRDIVGILLSAGRSTRFGSNKCLVTLENGVAVGLQSALNLAAAVDRVVCVVAPDQESLQTIYANAGFDSVVCADARTGMSASLQAGLRSASEAVGWVIALADMPWIQPATCRRVAATLGTWRGIVAPTYNDRRGHPVGFSRDYIEALNTLKGDVGAKALLDQNSDAIRLVPVDDPGIHLDIDEPGDLPCAS